MQTLVRHLIDKGQYECLTCHSREASIAGRVLTFTYHEMHNGTKLQVGLVYEGDCDTCKPEPDAELAEWAE